MSDLWKVGEGQKLRNQKGDDGKAKIYQEGEILPEGFIPDPSWIEQGVVVKVTKTAKTKVKEADNE